MNTEELTKFVYDAHVEQADFAAHRLSETLGPLGELVIPLIHDIVFNGTFWTIDKLSQYFELNPEDVKEALKAALQTRCDNIKANKENIDEHMEE